VKEVGRLTADSTKLGDPRGLVPRVKEIATQAAWLVKLLHHRDKPGGVLASWWVPF
jgi:hypothetical protein